MADQAAVTWSYSKKARVEDCGDLRFVSLILNLVSSDVYGNEESDYSDISIEDCVELVRPLKESYFDFFDWTQPVGLIGKPDCIRGSMHPVENSRSRDEWQ